MVAAALLRSEPSELSVNQGRGAVSSWAQITMVASVSDEHLAILQEWQRQRMIQPAADTTWLELDCKFRGDAPGPEREAVVLAPRSPLSAGDRLELEGTAALGVTFPDEQDGHAPRFVATTVVQFEDGWQASCAAATVGTFLFRLSADGLTAAQVFRSLIPGTAVQLWGDSAAGVLHAMSWGFGLAARTTIGASATIDFALWLPCGLPFEILHAQRRGLDLQCSWTEARSLIWRDGSGAEAVVSFEDARPVDLSLLPTVHYFTTQPEATEAIRIERPDRLSAEVLEVITSQRPNGTVTFRVDGQDRLVVGTGDDSAGPVTLDGPGFTTHLGHRDVELSVPYFAALALYNSAGRHPAAMWIDNCWGIVMHEEMMAELIWSTRTTEPKEPPDGPQ